MGVMKLKHPHWIQQGSGKHIPVLFQSQSTHDIIEKMSPVLFSHRDTYTQSNLLSGNSFIFADLEQYKSGKVFKID